MNYINLKNFFLLVLVLSIISLSSVFYIDFIIGIKPCKLCLYQRTPYLIAIFISLLGFLNSKNFLWLYFLIFIFLISSIISGYHIGIENNIFEEFKGCTSKNLNLTTKSEIIKSLNNASPNCKNVSFRIFGFSLATINFIISTIITIFSAKILINEKNK